MSITYAAPTPQIPGTIDQTDEQLLAMIAARNAPAFTQFYERHLHLAMVVAYRTLDDHQAAEDAVQAAFLSVWRFAPGFQSHRGSVRAWLLTIVRHAAIDRRRGRLGFAQRHASFDDVAHLFVTDGQETFLQAAAHVEADRVRVALECLPLKQREVVELAYFSGLSGREIADRIGVPIGTVKGRMRLGMGRLRVALADMAPPEPMRISAA